jgi:hypothetical protein
LEASRVSYKDLNAQIADYIALVINWNLHESSRESALRILLRRSIVAPVWWLASRVFRWNLWRP